MRIHAHVVLLSAASLVPFAVEAQQTPPDVAARTNAEQQQQVDQRRDAQQREATVAAPAVRSTTLESASWPELPVEQSCFPVPRVAACFPVSSLSITLRVPQAVLENYRFDRIRRLASHDFPNGRDDVDMLVDITLAMVPENIRPRRLRVVLVFIALLVDEHLAVLSRHQREVGALVTEVGRIRVGVPHYDRESWDNDGTSYTTHRFPPVSPVRRCAFGRSP
jgi:hypothetical protein